MYRKLRQLILVILSILIFTPQLYARPDIMLTDNEKLFLREHPVITVHNEEDYPPYNFNENGKPKGLSIDYINLLADRIGIKLKYVSGYDWNGFMTLIKEGKLDVMLNIMRSAKRDRFLHFTEPYAATKKAIFTNNSAIKTLKNLNDKIVCVPKSFFVEYFLEAYYPDIVLLEKKSILDCVKSVVKGESSATVGSQNIISHLLIKEHINISYVEPIPDKRLTIGLSIATASHLKILRDIIQKAMYSVSEDELSVITKKWIDPTKELQKRNKLKPYLQKRIITMCNNPNWTPIEFAKDGDMRNMQGIAIDTLKLLEKSLNIEFKTIPTKSWSESQRYLKEGKCEILPAAISTKKRKKYANFTTPYLIYKLAIITKNDKPFTGGLEDIIDKTISRKKGSGLINKLKNLYPDVKILETKDYLESLQKVSSGKAYCTIATLPVASYFISRFSLSDLHVAGYTDMRYKLSIAVNKKDTKLLSVLNNALSRITYKQKRDIYDNWVGGDKLVESYDYRYILFPAIVVLIILLLLWYRQRLLKKLNRDLKKEIEEKVNENMIQYQFIQEQAKLADMGEMIGVIAHQWRQPLNALGLSIQNLSYNYKDGLVDKEFIDQYIEKNLNTIRFMSQTVDDFKDFFKVGKVKEYFSIKEGIEATLQMQSLYLEKYGISYNMTGDDFSIYGLKSEFQQVVLNLISNAKDALVENRESDRSIEIYLDENIVVFMDNGGGISDDVINHIFDSYYTTKEDGFGIGLYMSKIIIEENLDGKMSAYSKGDGTVMLLDFTEAKYEED